MSLFMEIDQSAWQVAAGLETQEFPLERTGDGALTEACRLRVIAGLRAFIDKQPWSVRRRAFVALGGRGVSLRRLSVPPAAKDEMQRLLALQIESEFPLPPAELAWGWQAIGQINGRQEVLIAAVKKSLVEPYAAVLAACGVGAIFTIAALARTAVCPPPLPSCGVAYVGRADAEIISFEKGVPSSIRVLPANALMSKAGSGPVYLTGPGARAASTGSLPVLEGGNAIAGMRKLSGEGAGTLPLVIRIENGHPAAPSVATLKWAALAAVLLMAVFCFPYAEAVVLQPHLSHKLAAIETDSSRLPAIDEELDFLKYIKSNQPPYLDTIYLVSKVAPQGTSFESLSMTRRGDFSIRGKFGNAQQVTEFRSNLVQSAWFSSVVVDEQMPGQNQQVTVRMTARVKPAGTRKPVVVEVPPSKTDETNSSAKPPRNP